MKFIPTKQKCPKVTKFCLSTSTEVSSTVFRNWKCNIHMKTCFDTCLLLSLRISSLCRFILKLGEKYRSCFDEGLTTLIVTVISHHILSFSVFPFLTVPHLSEEHMCLYHCKSQQDDYDFSGHFKLLNLRVSLQNPSLSKSPSHSKVGKMWKIVFFQQL